MGETNAVTSGSKQVWIVAGALMIGSVLLGPVLQVGSYLGPTGSLLSTLLMVVSMIMFAIGADRSTSVTARRPFGTAALIGLAVWTAVGTPALGALDTMPGRGAMIGVGYVDLIVTFVLAAIATTQIARAGIVPRPWNLAPLWVLVAAASVRVVQLVVVVAAGPDASRFAPFLSTLDRLGGAVAPVFLGIVAIVLASRDAGVAAAHREQES
ncbi:hypothetical protein A4X17_08160 [Plantibacter sp. H53]|uniref:hypothetical protein n=1 Tax=Plantibacter sp. H53 TaxID=1827323 RepID=UPI0007DA23B7|nr:hypothetical protein [Plantibacter sp. H53]OAN27232.1 hypothetical protein A4X17_08160 [Plantibacter sp. H53]